MEVEGVNWVPGQDIPKIGPDFRSLEATVRGFKVGHSSTANTIKTQPAVLRQKNAVEELAEDNEMKDVPSQTAAPLQDNAARNVVGVGSKSSRPWKVAQPARSSGGVHKPTSKSWEAKMRLKKERKLNQIAAQEARKNFKETQRARFDQKREAEQRKEENRKKNDAAQGVGQMSAATARKLMKSKKHYKKVLSATQAAA